MHCYRIRQTLLRLVSVMLVTCILGRFITVETMAEGEVYRSVKNDSMKIALTFDDGPHPILTQRILDILDAYDVKATFFMVGVNVLNYPDAARAVLRAGHEVGNHTFSHSHLKRLSEEEVVRELGLCEDALEELCEYRPHLFRPPEGAVNTYVEHCSESNDYKLILWSLDTRDWENKETERIVETVLSNVESGDIILMHDYTSGKNTTCEALKILIPEILKRGYEFVTVSELISGAPD